ncbi:unnamed protein product [Dibothriocephalus latus]|uniref:Uncharacterized protein n=1 Tax=Dibothriocephalus latus TaxID=60516 RepID=A0A3P6V032_DIBLA|nr:unnamed protein product [Dibothriocephalus latus]
MGHDFNFDAVEIVGRSEGSVCPVNRHIHFPALHVVLKTFLSRDTRGIQRRGLGTSPGVMKDDGPNAQEANTGGNVCIPGITRDTMEGDWTNTQGSDTSASRINTHSANAMENMLTPSTSLGVTKGHGTNRQGGDTVTGRRPTDEEIEDVARDIHSGSNMIGRTGMSKKGRHEDEDREPEFPFSEDG